MNGNNKGETIEIKRVGNAWFKKYKYYQTRCDRIKKQQAISDIKQAFQEGKNIELFGHNSFEKELAEMYKSHRYYFEFWDDKP